MSTMSGHLRTERERLVADLEQLGVDAGTGARPTGLPQVATLGDAVVHGLDVPRPLGIAQDISRDVFVPVADLFADGRWPLTVPLGGAGRRRFAGREGAPTAEVA